MNSVDGSGACVGAADEDGERLFRGDPPPAGRTADIVGAGFGLDAAGHTRPRAGRDLARRSR